MAIFMTPRQVAERWGCKAGHVRRLCASGDLRAMRLGLTAWRISLAAVEAYEQAHTSGAEPAPAPKAAPKKREVRAPAVVDGFTLPDGYEPCFPALWGMDAPTKKAAPQRH